MCQTRNSRGGLFGVLFSVYDAIKMKWDSFIDTPNGDSQEQNSPNALLGLYQFYDFYFLLLFTAPPHFHLSHIFGQSTSYYRLHSALSPVEAGKHGDKKKPAAARNPYQDFREMLSRRQSEQWVWCVQEKFNKDKVAALSPKRYSFRRRQKWTRNDGRKNIYVSPPERNTLVKGRHCWPDVARTYSTAKGCRENESWKAWWADFKYKGLTYTLQININNGHSDRMNPHAKTTCFVI